jgi:hypothetical protein
MGPPMRSRSFPLTLDCEGCCAPARLKLINAYPFTKGVTEATYACSSCGHTMKLAVQISESGSSSSRMETANPSDAEHS